MFAGNQQRANHLNQAMAHEARLNRLHRLFKTQFNVTEPSMIMDPYLFLGNCISAHDVNRLARLGIRYVLNVAIRDVEVCPYYSADMRTLTIDLRDDDRENILRTFDQAFAFIDEARRAKSRVLVHCSHGQSRSPAIVIAYLMRSYHVPLEQCLMHVVKARPCVIPNDGFLKQLILYDRFLVERRRQQQRQQAEEARRKEAQAVEAALAASAEIPIQQHPTPAQIHIAPISTPPTSAQGSESDGTHISSVDSSSLATSSTSSVKSSSSANSIHVIPIQVLPKENKPSVNNAGTGSDNSSINSRTSIESSKSPEMVPEQKSAHPNLPTTSAKPSTEVSASQHAHHSLEQLIDSSILQVSHVQHYDPASTITLSEQQWNFLNHYPDHFFSPNEYKPTRYITEIYDRATNRFIPTTCCY